MIFHGAFPSVLNLLTHEVFKALFIDSNSLIFNPLTFLSPINVFVLILCGLLSHIKSNMVLSTLLLKFSGNGKTEALYISLDNPSDLTMLIFPKRVSFLLFQELRIFFQIFKFLIKIKTFAFASLVGEMDT